MNCPIIKNLFASLLVVLLSPANGQVVSGRVKLEAVVQSAVTVTWTWQPTPEEMGGLSTNDYCTNVWFQLLSCTNVTMPMTNWTIVLDNIPSAPWKTQYVAQVGLPSNSGPQFYAGRTLTVRDKSPFSNVASYVHAGGQLLMSIGQ